MPGGGPLNGGPPGIPGGGLNPGGGGPRKPGGGIPGGGGPPGIGGPLKPGGGMPGPRPIGGGPPGPRAPGNPGGGGPPGNPAGGGPRGIMAAGDGPPSPLGGATPRATAGFRTGATANPLPAARPIPGPAVPTAVRERASSGGGGASTDIDTMISPRKMINPSDLLITFSSLLPFPPTLRNSSVSANTRFMCLSKAKN